MNSFLITFEPATENPEQGWPIEELRRLARQNSQGKSAEERVAISQSQCSFNLCSATAKGPH